jgi:hypothetical protein
MHRPEVVRLAAILGTAVGLALTGVFVLRSPLAEPIAEPTVVAGTSGGTTSYRAPPESLAALVTSRNPFRLTRRPALVSFDPERAEGAQPLPPATTAAPATLVLVGTVIGAEAAALLEGVPGAEGTRILRVGERVGVFIVRAIHRDRIEIAGPDSTWTLRVRSTYP